MKKLKRKLLFTPVALPLMALPSITACTAAPLTKHDELINNLKNVDNPNGQWTSVDYVATPYKNYKLYVHNPELSSYVTSNHTKAQMGELSSKLNKATSFEAKKFEKGTFVPAAQVNDGQAQAYTAVWVRDTVWNVLALYDSGKTEDADAVTTSLMKYFGTEKQIARINDVMNDPKILLEKDGASKAVHIRFDPNTLDAVYIDGKEQTWSHKQNDALGLSISLFIDFASKNLNNVEKWPTQAEDMKTLVRLIAYLNRAEFWNMEDSGAWEEDEKISSS